MALTSSTQYLSKKLNIKPCRGGRMERWRTIKVDLLENEVVRREAVHILLLRIQNIHVV